MKKLIFAAAVLFSCLSVKIADAQVRVSLGFNIGSQPDWGPVGYDHASYYYMPDLDAYYDVTNHQYVYNENNVWVHNTYLPSRYNYDKYRTYKVVVNEPTPWERASVYRTRYASYRGRHDQVVIRDSRDTKYRNHYREVAERNREVSERNREASERNREVADRNREVQRHNVQVSHRNAREEKHIHHEIRKEEHRD